MEKCLGGGAAGVQAGQVGTGDVRGVQVGQAGHRGVQIRCRQGVHTVYKHRQSALPLKVDFSEVVPARPRAGSQKAVPAELA